MRNVFLTLLLLFAFSCKQKQSILNKTPTTKFRIDKIAIKEKFYLITAYRNDSVFTIVSNKSSNFHNETDIIGRKKYYNLSLKKLYPQSNFISYAEIDYYIYKGVKIKVDNKNHWSIYHANNLDGLCISK